jgi:hypothetical protein
VGKGLHQFIILVSNIKPEMAKDFVVAIIKYLWPKPDHYKKHSDRIHFEYHHVVNGSTVITHAWFQFSDVGEINCHAFHDNWEDTDALSDAGDSDYDDEIHTRGGAEEHAQHFTGILRAHQYAGARCCA